MRLEADSPVGVLYADATKRASKKAGGQHTSEAECGCAVAVSFFTKDSHTVNFSRCSLHPEELP